MCLNIHIHLQNAVRFEPVFATGLSTQIKVADRQAVFINRVERNEETLGTNDPVRTIAVPTEKAI